MDFENYLKEKDRSEHTVHGYLDDIEIFTRWFNARHARALEPAELTPTDVREYRAWLLTCNMAPASINRRLAALRAWGDWSIATKQIETNPAAAVRGIKLQRATPKWLDRKQQARLIREFEREAALARTLPARRKTQRNLAIVLTLMHTGLRISELCALRVTDITLGERGGKLVVLGKGQKSREVMLNATVREALFDWLDLAQPEGYLFAGDSGPLVRQSVGEMLAEYGRRAEVPSNPHTLRHTFAKNLVDAGVPLDQVAALLGHAKLETTRIYTLPGEIDLQNAVEKLA